MIGTAVICAAAIFKFLPTGNSYPHCCEKSEQILSFIVPFISHNVKEGFCNIYEIKNEHFVSASLIAYAAAKCRRICSKHLLHFLAVLFFTVFYFMLVEVTQFACRLAAHTFCIKHDSFSRFYRSDQNSAPFIRDRNSFSDPRGFGVKLPHNCRGIAANPDQSAGCLKLREQAAALRQRHPSLFQEK